MKKIRVFLVVLLAFGGILLQQSCQKEENYSLELKSSGSNASVTPYVFNWETSDWMPTPPGQSQIPTPWVGQGSIASVYGLDVINDRRASDGWVLVYNTFTPESSGPLNNPYFILYNKYRGLMRIFIYTTTEFVVPSSYIQDGLTIISNHETSLFNYLGSDLVDVSKKQVSFHQMQPAPDDGSLPLATNKWYMLQYELAYDPNLSLISYQDIQLNWVLNYYNVETISLGGNIVGTLESAVGSQNEIFSALGNIGKVTGTLAVAGIGANFFNKRTINGETGENKLGLPNKVFKAASEGATKAISNAQSGLPKAIVNFLGALIGGSSSGTTASFNLNATVELEGTGTNGGSFPSSPTSMWIPGTSISQDAIGFIPLYNKRLGVFNLVSKPTIEIEGTLRRYNPAFPSPLSYIIFYKFPDVNYSDLLVLNPDLLEVADISIVDQQIIAMEGELKSSERVGSNCSEETIGNYDRVFIDPTTISISNGDWDTTPSFNNDALIIGVRFTVKIVPKNGAPSSLISKTFLLNVDLEKKYEYRNMP